MEQTQYSVPARLLHWIMALLILSTLPAGFLMVQSGIGRDLQNALFLYHKNIGVVLLGLAFARLIWRWRNPPPPLPKTMPALQRGLAHVSHLLLYGLMFVLPVAGYIRVRAGGFPIEMLDALNLPTLVPRSEPLADLAKAVHYYAGVGIALLIAMHVGAALFHAFVKRDGIWGRMWPPAERYTR